MWNYKGFIIKPYAVIKNGYKYAIYESDGIKRIGSVKRVKDIKPFINEVILRRNENK